MTISSIKTPNTKHQQNYITQKKTEGKRLKTKIETAYNYEKTDKNTK